MSKALFVLAAAAIGPTALADFSYADFSSLSDLQLNGTAAQVGNVVRMTVDGVGDQAGNMWHTQLQPLTDGFSTTFQFRCDGVGTIPADGMAFAIQGSGVSELGSGGGWNAMGDIPGSVVVNFQSFWNKVQIIATDSNGSSVYFDEVDFFGLHQEEAWTARIDYSPTGNQWQVWLDGSPVISASSDLLSAVSLSGGTSAYVGLGAGTGLGYDNNDALAWSMNVVPEPASLLTLGALSAWLLRRRRLSGSSGL